MGEKSKRRGGEEFKDEEGRRLQSGKKREREQEI